MTPLLFALVDAALLEKVWRTHGVATNYALGGHLAHFTLAIADENEAFDTYGWWRSTWGER